MSDMDSPPQLLVNRIFFFKQQSNITKKKSKRTTLSLSGMVRQATVHNREVCQTCMTDRSAQTTRTHVEIHNGRAKRGI